jgi:16S rRNA (guanine527-N7)-methyltransferase
VKRRRIVTLCDELGLAPGAEARLELLLEVVAREPGAPTSITDPAEAADVHIADSLSVVPLVRSLLRDRLDGAAIVDIGSGAGFPGLPLAVALDRSWVDLLESTQRKCRFIAGAIERLELANAEVICKRAETWAGGEGAGRYRLAAARAVAQLATLVEYASPLLGTGGFLVAWKGARDADEERRGAAAARAVGMAPHGVHPVAPYAGSRRRHLHVFAKQGPTPAGIPRRAGLARKRPLGGE